MNPVELTLFSSRMNAICDEMGGVLRRAAFSPNIRDRLDFSCAIFDAAGDLCAQAAHIPVHLGSMAYAMRGIVDRMDWQAGDTLVFNDPYLGGTHLPDVTLIGPLYQEGELAAFVVNRAHHADVGGAHPGSMAMARSIYEEGIRMSRLCHGKLEEAEGKIDRISADGQRAPLFGRCHVPAANTGARLGVAVHDGHEAAGDR